MADPTISMGDDLSQRNRLALESAWQVEALSHMILCEIAKINISGDEGIKAAVIRIRDLSKVVMSALDDEIHEVSDLHLTVHGVAMKAEVQHG